ncbi:MAG TPA: S8 family serine peptidase [Thermoanaerobaculia bacterium]|nr:S8 family serine peptidase [Thermoanaerobaculia bacterium]
MKFVRFLVLFFAFPLLAGERYIVEFHDASAARARGGIARDRVRREFSRVLNGVAIELREGESIESIQRLPNVVRVTKDTIVSAFGDEVSFSNVAPHANGGGDGVIVAVIDSGIDYTHPALGNGFGPGKKVAGGYDFVNEDGDPMDDHRHGTHVAGIIAAQSPALTGIAPRVTLLAYKVLGANGKGQTSDIIAGIERAVADGADVINLSLGGPGNPDDPLSRAVENAIAHGVVVCVAAGNDGVFHAIGSPAGAPSAITVGATDGDAIAEFSSRGPATQTGAIKPDLLAPGAGIVSTIPGGGTQALSGTSMATPYVAALAALLREAHPDWTPARIKTALVATAVPLANEEVMTQGSGRADRTRAFENTLALSSTQLNFGLDGSLAGAWQQTRRISIRNESDAPRTIHATTTTPNAIAISIVPQELTLAPGESRDLDVTVQVDHEALGVPQTASLAFSGVLAFENEQQTLRVPWAFLRAARATITYEHGYPTALWKRLPDGYESAMPIHPNGLEILLKPGVYDFVVIGEHEGDVRLFIAEERSLEGDLQLSFTDADAPHELRFDAETPVAMGEGSAYVARARLVFTDPSASITLPYLFGRSMHATSFSDRFGLLVTESFVSENGTRIAIAQHPLVAGLSSDATLHLGSQEYAAQPLEVHFPSDSAMRDVIVMPRDWPRRELEHSPIPPYLRVSSDAAVWKATLYLTPEVHEDFASGLQISTLETEGDLGFWAMTTPMIRRDDRGFFSARGFLKPALPMYAAPAEPLVYADRMLRPGPAFSADGTFFLGDPSFRGDRDESRRATKLDTRYRVVDAANFEIASGAITPSQLFVSLPRRGRYRAELRTQKRESAVLTMNFDTTDGDVAIPAFTWLSVHDAEERRTTRLPFNGAGTLLFAAKNISAARTAVFVRRHGFSTWVQLTPVELGADELTGVTYRIDLADALRLQGELDLSIEIGDANGNTATWQLDRAFASIAEPARTKRRAAGH